MHVPQLKLNPKERAKINGDVSLIPANFNGTTQNHVSKYLGPEFVERVSALKIDQWDGPIESPFGWHLVKRGEIVAGGIPSLEKIRKKVMTDWLMAEQDRYLRDYKRKLREQYRVIIQHPIAEESV